ncbi:hypothetical protein SAMN04489745_3603 [Arthrobacter woluwensis]|uniref:Uncharacterized protein n=1 Tax=Arthrobacter woluwensis TaxID=156980 RepID=A0A1H4JPF8_9MICC|nr:hypothetical protein SAMN04489745_0311 [Arthrobacter woluwensis]SEC98022.1 hypothetical protein SAMN04489745_3603 [Arthrobacter woluwensis]
MVNEIKGMRIEDRHQNQHNRPGNPIYSTHFWRTPQALPQTVPQGTLTASQ